MKICKLLIAIYFLSLSMSCSKSDKTNDTAPVLSPITFAKGADISWLTEMESAGKSFYNSSGIQQDLLVTLKSLGMNTIRLRVWVDPLDPWNDIADVVGKAVRAKNLGMRILIDFHYSNTWADPGNQSKPSSWSLQNFAALKSAVYAHTRDVLLILRNNGVTPEWVQVGNETNDGMLWPDGKASVSMNNFAQLINSGYQAVKSVSPETKVIVHLSNGWDNNLFRWIFDGLRANGAQWDVIGMSLYPGTSNWASLNSLALANMNDMVARYGSQVMMVEIGMSWDNTSAHAFISDLIQKIKSVNNNKGIGVIYWEPQAYANWKGYTLGAFDNTGKPTPALHAFN